MIWELRHERKITLLLDIAKLSLSTYYYYIKHMKDGDKYSEIKKQIADIFKENKGRYGYRRVTMELHNKDYVINHKTVLRLMNEGKLKCEVRIKKYHSYKGESGKVAPNLLEGASALRRRTKSGLRTSRSSLSSDRNFIFHRYPIFVQAI